MRKTLFLLALLASTPAFAQGGNIGPMAPETRELLRRNEHAMRDLDANGMLDGRERMQDILDAFDAADTDKDGVISAEERAAAITEFREEKGEAYGKLTDTQAARQDKMFNTMDADEDGNVSEQEYNAYNQQRYQGMDTDQNGVITADEYRFKGEKARTWKKYD